MSRGKDARMARRAAQFSKFRLVELNLIPLVDTFVSIVFFALTTATVGELSPVVPGVRLPTAGVGVVALSQLTLGIGAQVTLERASAHEHPRRGARQVERSGAAARDSAAPHRAQGELGLDSQAQVDAARLIARHAARDSGRQQHALRPARARDADGAHGGLQEHLAAGEQDGERHHGDDHARARREHRNGRRNQSAAPGAQVDRRCVVHAATALRVRGRRRARDSLLVRHVRRARDSSGFCSCSFSQRRRTRSTC